MVWPDGGCMGTHVVDMCSHVRDMGTLASHEDTWTPREPMEAAHGGGGWGGHTYHIPNKRLNDVAKLAGHLVVVAPGASWWGHVKARLDCGNKNDTCTWGWGVTPNAIRSAPHGIGTTPSDVGNTPNVHRSTLNSSKFSKLKKTTKMHQKYWFQLRTVLF